MSFSFRNKILHTEKCCFMCLCVCFIINIFHFFVKFVDIFGVMLQKKDGF